MGQNHDVKSRGFQFPIFYKHLPPINPDLCYNYKMWRKWRELKKTKKNSLEAGFSLIELMVAMSIFTIVVTIATGACFIIFDSLRRTQNAAVTLNNIDFAFDFIIQTIINEKLVCDNSYKNANSIIYHYDGNIYYNNTSNSTLDEHNKPIGTPLFPDELNVTGFTCSDEGSGLLSKITITVESTANYAMRSATDFEVELSTYVYTR